MKLRTLLPYEVTFTLTIEPEEIDPAGCFASGDADLDFEQAKEIRQRSHDGDEWAWFCAKVTATWGEFEASDYLGACSYKDEDDFKADQYYTDMCNVALDNLNAKIQTVFELVEPLIEENDAHLDI